MRSRDDKLWCDATTKFNAVLDALSSALPLLRPLPAIGLRRVFDPRMTARVRRSQAGRVWIEFGDEFLARLLNLVEQLDDDQIGRLLASSTSTEQLVRIEDARQAIYAIAEQFVFHHELFHVLCGHLDNRTASSPQRGFCLEELSVAALGPGARSSDEAVEARQLLQFIELEADNTALQFLVDKCHMGDLVGVFPALGAQDLSLSQVEGPDRVPAFRLCFAAVWLVLLLFEGARSERPSQSHPWPATRLLALLFTLLPYFSNIQYANGNGTGDARIVLTDESASAIKAFLSDVVRPAMKFVMAHADADDVLRRYQAPDPSRSSLLADVLHDLQALIFGAEVKSPSGYQLRELLGLHGHFSALLRPFCYVDFLQ